MLTNIVFSTMALEGQEVPKARVEQIVLSLLNEKELKGGQFFSEDPNSSH
jgi:hypothetical protein